MSVIVKIPTPLRTLTSGQAEIQVEARTVEEALRKLNGAFDGIGDRIFDENGELRRFINIYVNQDNIRDRSNLETKIQPGDTISILPSIAGGTSLDPSAGSERTSMPTSETGLCFGLHRLNHCLQLNPRSL